MNVEENEMETNAIVDSSGRVMLFRSMITDISCNLNLQQFPFDQQICFVTFASWSMDGSKLDLSATPKTDNLELYIRNTEWSLTDFRVKTYQKIYDCCPHPFPDVTYFMVLRRSPSYYIFSLVIPSAFITVVTIVGFFTPHSTTGENTEKVSLGVTALLSMAIISN
uniref:Neur_chan_LBD domain-containing protein n=2 Tax=Caenorhabditis japonica TaxID=281687 RepID=A0A8R1HT71_CAEJA